MAKKFGFILLAALTIALLPTSALFACTANCAHGSCSGTGSCTCDANDRPVCIDQVQESMASLNAQAEYARGFNTPGLNKFADAAQKMADALAQGDKDSYFIGILEREDALKALSQKEWKILNSWDGRGAGVNQQGPQQK
jgi:hypothetical protein